MGVARYLQPRLCSVDMTGPPTQRDTSEKSHSRTSDLSARPLTCPAAARRGFMCVCYSHDVMRLQVVGAWFRPLDVVGAEIAKKVFHLANPRGPLWLLQRQRFGRPPQGTHWPRPARKRQETLRSGQLTAPSQPEYVALMGVLPYLESRLGTVDMWGHPNQCDTWKNPTLGLPTSKCCA